MKTLILLAAIVGGIALASTQSNARSVFDSFGAGNNTYGLDAGSTMMGRCLAGCNNF